MFSNRKETAKALERLSAEVDSLRAELVSATEAAQSERGALQSIADRLGALEARVSGMGSELARQLHELGSELDELSKRAEDPALATLVESLRSSQIRLANEQARYEITFRQDLAELADRLLNLPRR